MKTASRITGLALLALLALLVFATLLVLAGAVVLAPFEHTVIHIDDAQFTLGLLHGSDWWVAILGVAIAGLIVLLVVPVAVLVPLLLAALVLTIALFTLAGVAALALAPLLLIGWALRWLLRPNRSRPPGATMAP